VSSPTRSLPRALCAPRVRVQIKTTKKVVLKLKCSDCGITHQKPIKRCKRFELGGEKKSKKSQKVAF
jgi:large subunit ribosomal protein L44e